MFLFWTAANGVFCMETVSDPKSIVDLLNGEAKYLSKFMPSIIRSEEIFIERSLSESSKKNARYQLICRVVQDLQSNYLSPDNNDKSVKPIPPNFFEVAMSFYEKKYAKKEVSSQ